MGKFWTLSMSNYLGQDEDFYFQNYEIAKQNFDALCKEHENDEEFELFDNGTSISWFDPQYNEYSTYVSLIEKKLKIHDKIIF